MLHWSLVPSFGLAVISVATLCVAQAAPPPAQAGDVPVITRKLVGHVDNSSYPLISVNIDMTPTTPTDTTGRGWQYMVGKTPTPR